LFKRGGWQLGKESYPKSAEAYLNAQRYFPGGVNSPVRAFKAVGLKPLFISRGVGPKICDLDGNWYLDFVCSWGALILGHCFLSVVEAIQECLGRGTSYGAPTELETELAELIIKAVPSIEMIRMVNSGTEATLSALRLARAFTRRDKVIKFEGCYHGHADPFLIKAGSGVLTLGIPVTPGIPERIAADTIVLPYNDLNLIEEVFSKEEESIAAVIVEPVAGNMGVVPPLPGFLEGLRKITQKYGSLLIFDEVITGFRVAYSGAQGLYDVEPDLTCLGKIIGGGLPVGAYGGKRAIMELVAPLGEVYQAGTLAGNPLAMSAGIATLKALQRQEIYQDLEKKASRIVKGFAWAASEAGIPVQVNKAGSMLSIFFTDKQVVDYHTAGASDISRFAARSEERRVGKECRSRWSPYH